MGEAQGEQEGVLAGASGSSEVASAVAALHNGSGGNRRGHKILAAMSVRQTSSLFDQCVTIFL